MTTTARRIIAVVLGGVVGIVYGVILRIEAKLADLAP
jgi:hypothetical protein